EEEELTGENVLVPHQLRLGDELEGSGDFQKAEGYLERVHPLSGAGKAPYPGGKKRKEDERGGHGGPKDGHPESHAPEAASTCRQGQEWAHDGGGASEGSDHESRSEQKDAKVARAPRGFRGELVHKPREPELEDPKEAEGEGEEDNPKREVEPGGAGEV